MLAALRTLEVYKINHTSSHVFVLTEYLIWFFWSPSLQKYFWVFGKAFYRNIATTSILKTLKVQHINYIRHVGFSIFDPPNFSPEQALPYKLQNTSPIMFLFTIWITPSIHATPKGESLKAVPSKEGDTPFPTLTWLNSHQTSSHNSGRCPDDK